MIDKKQILLLLKQHLKKELDTAIAAANRAHQAATDEESVAETKYDTFGLESSYLAHGQTTRALELNDSLTALDSLKLTEYNDEEPINLSALLQLSGESDNEWYFISPVAGGAQLDINEHKIKVITPGSPIASLVLGRYCGDEVTLKFGSSDRIAEITTLF